MKTRNLLSTVIALPALVVMSGHAGAQNIVDPGETHSFTQATRGQGTPFSDTVFKGTISFWDPARARAEAAAIMSIGAIKTQVVSFGDVITDFFVPAGSSGNIVLDATVSADVDWNGILFGASVLGGGAEVKIEMFLVDDSTGVVTGTTVVEKVDQESIVLEGLDVGGTVVTGNSKVSFPGKVTRGHQHSIHLKVTCKVKSGLIGLDVGSVFQNNVFGLGLGDRFVRWTTLSVSIEQDLAARLDQIDMKLDQVDMKIDQVNAALEAMDAKVNEIIRLLLTPQGLRSTDSLDFPQNPRKNGK